MWWQKFSHNQAMGLMAKVFDSWNKVNAPTKEQLQRNNSLN
jgi:hypothetical protein